MGTITLPNFRTTADVTMDLRLKDGGVAIDWAGLSNIKAWLYSDAQKAIAGRCDVSIDQTDNTKLVCEYSATKPQYLGVQRLIIQAKYRGRTKTYDKPVFNFVPRTADQEGTQIVIDDPEVDVEIEVTDTTSSILDNTIAAALAAAAHAEHAASLVPLQVLQDCEAATAVALTAASKAPVIGENGNWWVWDSVQEAYVDTGKQAKGDTGNGIASFSVVESQEDDADNVVTVTFTDGTTETFTVKNGKTGNGIASIVQTVESPDDAGTNVITVTMTNGTVITFNVKNGSKGQPGAAQAAYKSVETLPTASAATMDKIYLTPSGTSGVYNMSYTDYDGSAYSWVNMGTTAIQLSDYATKTEVSQLEAKVDGNEFALFNEGKLSAKYIANSYVKKEDGTFVSYNNWSRTDYINVVPFSTLKITATVASVYNGFYDKDKVFIDDFALSVGANTITIPDNVAYIVCSASTAGMLAATFEISGYRLLKLKSDLATTDAKVLALEADRTEIVANINFVSDNKAVNGFFKELYLYGINYANVASINVQGTQNSGITCTFKDSGNSTLATLANDGPLGNEFISRDVSGAIMLASVDWSGLDTVKAVVNSCTLTAKVGSLIKNPAIIGFLSRRTASNTIPTFTKNTSYQINSRGEVVSAGSSHFYSSPIAVKGGDCVLVRTYGKTGSAVISLTDANGTFYKPIAIYTGTDPDTYFYKVKENGFVAITGYNNAYFRLTVFRDSEIAAIYDKFKEGEDAVIAEMKAVPVDFRKRDSSVYVGADIDADWESVDGAYKTNSVQYNNVTRKRVRCATLTGPSGNGIARIRFSKSVNANLHPFLFSVCIGDYSDTENAPAGDIKLIFYSGDQAFGASRSMKIPLQTATGTPEYNTVFNRNGWFCICAFLPSHEGSGLDVGESFDPTNVTGFGVHLINSRSLPVTLHIERMDFLNDVMTKPGIVTIIDNFNSQVPTMADYAYSKGVRLNLSIIPGYYEGDPDAPACASKEEIARLAAQGHFIWNHTWSHPNFNSITVPQIHDQINLAERWMQLNGYGEGKRIVSIPSARFNTRSCNAALDTNVEMFFHSWVRQKKQVYIPFAPVNRLLPTTWLDSDALDAGMGGADIATVALKCLTYNGLTVVGFHGTYLTSEGGGLDEWKAYIDAIAASNAYFYGLDEILEGGWN